jgi:DNA-directed RNA polymerase subunit F
VLRAALAMDGYEFIEDPRTTTVNVTVEGAALIGEQVAEQVGRALEAMGAKTCNSMGNVPTKTAANATEELNNMKKNRTAVEVAEFFGVTEDEAKMMLAGYREMMSDKSEKKTMSAAVALSIGLGTEVDEPTIVARLSALSAFERDVLKSTGKQNQVDALGAISGFVSTQAQAQAAIGELATMKAQRSKDAIEALLSTAKAEKKITPAEFDDASEDGLRATALAKGEKGEQWLRAHMEKRVPIAALTVVHQQPKDPSGHDGEKKAKPGAGKKYAELSYMERDELSRRDPAAFDALRAEHLNSLPQTNTFPMHSPQAGALFRDLPSNAS